MSQFFTGITGSNLPPNIPTSFTTDQVDSTTAALVAPAGTATPVANILRVGGDNGIATYAVTLVPGALTIGFIRGAAVTTDGTTVKPILTQPTNTDATMTVQVIVAGFCTTNNAGIGAYGTFVIKNVAGTASVVELADFIRSADASISSPNPAPQITISVSGSTWSVNVVGVTGLTFNWEACLPGIIST